MIDFSGAKAMSIPEGATTEIHIGGVKVWEQPAELTFPEYIQLDGSQYLDTGIICDQDTKIELTFTREDDSARYLFGVSSTDNKASFTGYQSGTASGSWRFGAAYTRPSVTVDEKHTVTMDKNGVVMDGTKKSYTGTVGSFSTPQSLVVGGCKSDSGDVGTVRHVGKIYGFKLWDNGTLVQDLMPCIKADGTQGFYNNVDGEFVPLLT